jgi:hypothetical protein
LVFSPDCGIKKHKGEEKSTCTHPLQNGCFDFKFQFDGNAEIKFSLLRYEDLLFQGKTMEDRGDPQRVSAL